MRFGAFFRKSPKAVGRQCVNSGASIKDGIFAKTPQYDRGLCRGLMAPRARNKFGAPVLGLWEWMDCIEEKACDIVGTFRHPSMIQCTGYCSPLVTPQVWHFATKCTPVKFPEPWMLNHLSQMRDHSYVSSAMYQECPSKDWRGKSCWLNPKKSWSSKA